MSNFILKLFKKDIFKKHSAFMYENNKIVPVENIDDVSLFQLKKYDIQKEKLVKNTKKFIEGKSANNLLLYGDRGCGKSSCVKAVFNGFKSANLKIVQIYKDELTNLSKLIKELSSIKARFIIFIDDLSYEEKSVNLSALKTTLEGGLIKIPDNILIYATTNRRKIIKESTNEGKFESDTRDENASLSDRFGMTLTFLAPNKDDFIEMAHQIAQDREIEIGENFNKELEQFALLKGIRSPRVIHQFLNSLW